ncbi:hypothetical protein [Hymenobacter volaticus]|uniref:FtsX-like permease family protein n=1 Tax=Hymenobacter volaticus TaxID=2932254 RepID=A0ABY4GDP2_9BACT|nr:hypothetical protein [Hymenobacter volaticus]UOQ69040.1 hypothetical protein MUN86_26415 [Hymenobacter volaticus]
MDTASGLGHRYLFLLIVLCTTIGFLVSFLVLNTNYIQYTKIENKAVTKLADSSYITFNITQKIKLSESDSSHTFATIAQQNEKAIRVNTNKNLLFNCNPSFLVWTLLIICTVTIASGAFPIYIINIINIKKIYDIPVINFYLFIIFSVTCIFIITMLPSFLHGYYTPANIIKDFNILLTHGEIVQIFSILISMLSLPLIITMFLVGYVVSNKLFVNIIDTADAIKIVSNFNDLKSMVDTALHVLASIVVLAGFCSASLAKSIKAVMSFSNGFDIAPREASYAYGLFYALLLAICYVPVYYIINIKSIHLQKQITNFKFISSSEQNLIFQKLEGDLVSRVSVLENFKTALTILSPLLTSLIPEDILR